MTVTATSVMDVEDASGRRLGEFSVEEVRDGTLLLGRFQPSQRFAEVEPLFRAYQQVIDDMVLSLDDEYHAPIEALGIRLLTSGRATPVHDVQFWSDGNASCRLSPEPSRNGVHEAKP